MALGLTNYAQQFIENTDVVLDIGCGDKCYTNELVGGCKSIITLDAWDKVKPDICIDLETEDLPFEENSIDVIIMYDFIEHLDKDRGKQIIEQAKLIAKKCVLLFTPTIWSDNKHNVADPKLWCYGNEYDLHKSLWGVDDFDGWIESDYSDIPHAKNKYYLGMWNKG